MARMELIGMDEVKEALGEIAKIASTEALEQALMASATVYRDAIRAATPIGKYSYQRKSKKTGQIVTHTPGTARSNVIIYKRKNRAFTRSGPPELLVGYAKKPAFYMYWYEAGREKQTPRRFFESAIEGVRETALSVARFVLAARLAAEAPKARAK